MYAAKTSVSETSTKSDSPGIVIPPEKSLQLGMAPLPRTYLYICQRKGHTNMTGTLIVEYREKCGRSVPENLRKIRSFPWRPSDKGQVSALNVSQLLLGFLQPLYQLPPSLSLDNQVGLELVNGFQLRPEDGKFFRLFLTAGMFRFQQRFQNLHPLFEYCRRIRQRGRLGHRRFAVFTKQTEPYHDRLQREWRGLRPGRRPSTSSGSFRFVGTLRAVPIRLRTKHHVQRVIQKLRKLAGGMERQSSRSAPDRHVTGPEHPALQHHLEGHQAHCLHSLLPVVREIPTKRSGLRVSLCSAHPMGSPKLSWFGGPDNNVKVGKSVLQREEEGVGQERPGALLARRTRTMKGVE